MLNHVDDSMVKNLVAAGYSPDSVAAYQRAQKTAQVDFEIWQENWDSWIFFLQVSTQWNVAAGGIGGLFYVGLQRNCIESEMNMRGIKKAQRGLITLRFFLEIWVKNRINTEGV